MIDAKSNKSHGDYSKNDRQENLIGSNLKISANEGQITYSFVDSGNPFDSIASFSSPMERERFITTKHVQCSEITEKRQEDSAQRESTKKKMTTSSLLLQLHLKYLTN
jgi:hypothetical protein